ncbi:MAG: hypothetical protein CFE44_01960 [Burkholderiales bacterium PBB4]|nr:MAG: hypothetical protein CFE44_01960 [Burkholderiales bacterium PBB4]
MLNTARVFTHGHSQAIRLPKAFRVNVQEMWITKNEVTGEITLKPKDDDQRTRNLAELLQLVRANTLTEDFIPARNDASRPSPFEDGGDTGSYAGANL